MQSMKELMDDTILEFVRILAENVCNVYVSCFLKLLYESDESFTILSKKNQKIGWLKGLKIKIFILREMSERS